MARRRRIYGVALGLLDPAGIPYLSHGEVTRPRTVDAVELRPIPGGLFCPRIFGTTEAGSCFCGRLRGPRKKGIFCERCKVEVGDPKERKERLGHITLASPVVHVWFRGIIAALTGIPPLRLESVIRCSSYLVQTGGGSPCRELDIIPNEEYLKFRGSKGFRADTGGIAVKRLLSGLDIEALVRELRSMPPSRRVLKRLKIARDFHHSGVRPEWMVLEVLLVLPPGLRPIVPMENGAIASSDLNELYMKVITRNNRLKKYLFADAPEIVLNNEKRMLQDAVDALIDNTGKRRVMDKAKKRTLKSLSEMLQTKQGMLRRNLLGKRVDYSGRSVIAVGPELKFTECGIPKEMAMDMFRPFVYGKLLRRRLAVSLKHAKALVDSRSPEAVDALEKVMKGKTVLLNRAPSLHRMNIQAFSPVLVEGHAIRLHPLACRAFNADFDGDQMGVHIPVSYKAQLEAKALMLPVHNLLSPAHGYPVALPSQEIVLGIYYLTMERGGCRGEGMRFSDKEDVLAAYAHGIIEEHSKIKLRLEDVLVDTTAGRVVFNGILPEQLPFRLFNKAVKQKDISELLETCHERFGHEETVALLDRMKELGFRYATISGISLCADDLTVPAEKQEFVSAAWKEAGEIEEMFGQGLITREERYNRVVDLWNKAADRVAGAMAECLAHPAGSELNSIFLMIDSGARGSLAQLRQLMGMRGLMAKPTGEIVEIPITSCLKEGQTYFEFLIAAHGARKGRADGALRTARAGYFMRRLVDAVCDLFIAEEDCGTDNGIAITPLCEDGETVIPLEERIFGRYAAQDVIHPRNGKIIVRRNDAIDRNAAMRIGEAGISGMKVRSPATCAAAAGICAMCYGFDLSKRQRARKGDAVGIIAAQSIGEPGTQLTLRTFHSGGSAAGSAGRSSIEAAGDGEVKLNEIKAIRRADGRLVAASRGGSLSLSTPEGERELGSIPYGAVLHVDSGEGVQAGQKLAEWDPFHVPVISDSEGIAAFLDIVEGLTMRCETSSETGIAVKRITALFRDMIPKILIGGREYSLPAGAVLTVNEGDRVGAGEVIARRPLQRVRSTDIVGGLPKILHILEARPSRNPAIIAEIGGKVEVRPPKGKYLTGRITGYDGTFREYFIRAGDSMNVYDGEYVNAGELLVEGTVETGDVLRILGPERAAAHLTDEVQRVYRSQGVSIHDKHFELVARKMLGMVEIVCPGDTDFVHGEIV
ncbi:MAG TPA: DNA-directed RNA polymerase subunit beta', partial [Dissulfurispiraceae bacterium]